MSKVGRNAKRYFIAYGLRRIGHYEFWRVPFFKHSIHTLQKKDMANHILSLLEETRNIFRLTSVANFQKYGLYRPIPRVVGALAVDGACLGDAKLLTWTVILRGLIRGPSDEPTGPVKAKVARTSGSGDAAGSSLPPPLSRPTLAG
uniref:Uncharacterized protein n=1 Tax=Cannabis sativa TaxID=3483 RepID=A0A803PC60_CANSA